KKSFANIVGALISYSIIAILLIYRLRDIWPYFIIMPVLLFVFYKIHDHYLNVAEQLRLEETVKLHKYSGNTVIVLVGNVTKVNIGALNYARSIGDTVIAMHVSTTADSKREARIKKEFKERFPDIHFTIVNTEYRSVENPVIRYVDLVSKESDRKSTRLNSSHVSISYAVFFLKKKDNKV